MSESGLEEKNQLLKYIQRSNVKTNSDDHMSQPGHKCGVCDYVNVLLTPTCKNCNARLMKKRVPARSKRSKARDKNKRKRAQCSGTKVTFARKSEARMAAKKIQDNTGRMSKIYRCKTCNGYHLTKFQA